MTSKEGCNRFKNQVVVVTASTDGIGFAIARRIASEGAVVVISSRCKANVDEAVKKLESEGLNVKGVQCHVGNKEERMDLLRTATNNFKEKIDCLISNAAVSPYAGPTVDTPEPIFDKIFETNLKSSFLLTQDFRDWIKPNGNILYISSYIGYTPRQPLGVYAISKTALFGLTRAIAHDMWQQGKIRVNCIAPGIIQTRFSEVIWKDEETFEDIKKEIIMERAGRSEEIAGAAAFLCSSDGSYVTGETLVVGGGVTSRL